MTDKTNIPVWHIATEENYADIYPYIKAGIITPENLIDIFNKIESRTNQEHEYEQQKKDRDNILVALQTFMEAGLSPTLITEKVQKVIIQKHNLLSPNNPQPESFANIFKQYNITMSDATLEHFFDTLPVEKLNIINFSENAYKLYIKNFDLYYKDVDKLVYIINNMNENTIYYDENRRYLRIMLKAFAEKVQYTYTTDTTKTVFQDKYSDAATKAAQMLFSSMLHYEPYNHDPDLRTYLYFGKNPNSNKAILEFLTVAHPEHIKKLANVTVDRIKEDSDPELSKLLSDAIKVYPDPKLLNLLVKTLKPTCELFTCELPDKKTIEQRRRIELAYLTTIGSERAKNTPIDQLVSPEAKLYVEILSELSKIQSLLDTHEQTTRDLVIFAIIQTKFYKPDGKTINWVIWYKFMEKLLQLKLVTPEHKAEMKKVRSESQILIDSVAKKQSARDERS